MPVNGQKDACGRVYPHAKWGQDCGDRQGRQTATATAPRPNRPADACGRPWGDPNYGSDCGPARPRRDTGSQPSPQPAPQPDNTAEQDRLQADYDQRQAFLAEEQALLERERQMLEEDYERQKAYFEQDAALSEQERALALQELETQLKYQREQLELRRQQAQSDLDEEKRQGPLRLRDIADQFAAQGAFFSGRRGEAQNEATIASNLAIQGLERQLLSDKMTAEESEALAAIKRGQFGLDAQRQVLESETRLAGMRADLEQAKLRGDLDYREKSYELKQILEEEKRKLTEALTGGGSEGKVLTKSDLGTMLRQGIINKKQYKQGLQAQGYSKDQAKALYLSEMAKGPLGGSKAGGTKLSVSQLSTMARQGLVDKGTYIKALKGKGYSAEEAKALYASEMAKGSGGKMITKSDIAGAVSEGIMSPDAGYKNLRALGYDDYSARVIIANAEKDKADSARSASRRSSGKDLTKTDWLSLYRNKMISEGELVTGLKSLGYSSAEAKALAANAKASASRSSSSASRTLTGEEQIRVGESLISPTRINERNPGTFLRKYWNEFTDDFEDVQAYVSQTTGTVSLPSYIAWWKKQYLAADDRHTPAGATATLQKYSKTISLAWYFYFYGGGMQAAYQTSTIGA